MTKSQPFSGFGFSRSAVLTILLADRPVFAPGCAQPRPAAPQPNASALGCPPAPSRAHYPANLRHGARTKKARRGGLSFATGASSSIRGGGAIDEARRSAYAVRFTTALGGLKAESPPIEGKEHEEGSDSIRRRGMRHGMPRRMLRAGGNPESRTTNGKELCRRFVWRVLLPGISFDHSPAQHHARKGCFVAANAPDQKPPARPKSEHVH